jgi:hypothetical protein
VAWAHSSDRATIDHLCRLEDAAQELCAVLDCDGPVLKKPLISPRGEVVGEECYEHPGLKGLRALDKPLLELRAALWLDPQSRARLKLAVQDAPGSLTNWPPTDVPGWRATTTR